jgi:hypothetical protein
LISFGVLCYTLSAAKAQNRSRGIWLTLSATFGILALIVLVFLRPDSIHMDKDST